MKIAVIADVHANLEALEAVLIDVDKIGVDRIICLGDVVGYGIDPLACINRLKEVEAECLLGNHDQATIDRTHIKTLNPLARESVLRTYDFLGEALLVFRDASPMGDRISMAWGRILIARHLRMAPGQGCGGIQV